MTRLSLVVLHSVIQSCNTLLHTMPRNNRTTALMTISLPRAMAAKVEHTRKAEQRTRSELVREALRTYFAVADRYPEAKATPAELRALKKGRAEYLRGETTSLDAFRREMGSRTRTSSAKKSRRTARR